MANSPDDTLLRTALKASVPIWFIELSVKGEAYWMSRKGICSQAVAEKGDVLMYGSKKVGAAADVFNRLAEGCALLMLITKHPFEIFDLRFNPDGKIEDLRDMQQGIAEKSSPQSQALPAVRSGPGETAGREAGQLAGEGSAAPGGDNEAK